MINKDVMFYLMCVDSIMVESMNRLNNICYIDRN